MQKEKFCQLNANKNGGLRENVDVNKHNLHLNSYDRLLAKTQDAKQLHKPVLGRSVD